MCTLLYMRPAEQYMFTPHTTNSPACGGNLGGEEQLCRNALTVASSHITWPSQALSLSLVFFNLFLPFLDLLLCTPPPPHLNCVLIHCFLLFLPDHMEYQPPPPPSLNISFSFSYIYFCSSPRAVRLVFLHSFLFYLFPRFTLIHHTGCARPSPL